MDRKRPQGRDKYVTGSSSVHKRGDGLNTGPVGSGNAFTSQNSSQSGGSQTGGSQRQTRSGGGRSPLLYIIILVIALLGGGGGLSSLLGGSGGDTADQSLSQSTAVVTTAPNNNNNGNIFTQGGGSQAAATPKPTATPKATATPKPASNTAAAGVRERYTTIQGNSQDTVTIMVYMCGTDLESNASMATNDLVEMSKAKWGDNLHVIVYTGGCTRWQNKIVSSKTNQIYEVVNGGLKTLESDLGAAVMTKPETLASFIQWCTQHYPANRNELILWDHGGGSVSGYGYDEKFKSAGSMNLAGIAKALQSGGVKFDFIGFDACLMATLETGLMLDDFADYLVASEETEPGIGWYYTDWLNAFGSNTSLNTVEVGKNIVDSFVRTCSTSCPGQSATLSVVDLAELSASVPDSLKSFSQSLSSLITNEKYQQISSARNNTREFARSSMIDQIDLVDFANRVGTVEASQLASTLKSAVKYNRTSSNMTNCYGVSIYFPYRKTSTVSSAISTYNAIGMDESYTQAIREFAGLEVSGQASSYGGYSTGAPGASVTSLLEALMGASPYSSSSSGGGSYGSADMISSLLSAFMGSSGGDIFSGRSMSMDDTVSYIEANFFDASALQWTQNSAGQTAIILPEDQWDLVEDVALNMFFDDGEGYIDLGLDNVFEYDNDGNLLAPTDRTWIAVNGQPVAYYHEYTSESETRGYIPAMLNGQRVELLVMFDDVHPHGVITGARYIYVDGETETVAKSLEALVPGDELQFLCDYYTYNGDYSNTYYLGEPMTVTDTMEISNVEVVGGDLLLIYRFTDLYQQHYWTPALAG